MLEARGLRLVRHFWHMRSSSPDAVDPGPSPQGIDITGMRSPDDLPAFHAVLDEAFADHWDHHPEPFDSWAEEMTHGPSYDPTLWLLARKDGELVGALTATVLGDRGWVSLLGVSAPFRGRGIAAALLRRSFADVRRSRGPAPGPGCRRGEPDRGYRALRACRDEVVKRWDLWEREVRGSAA